MSKKFEWKKKNVSQKEWEKYYSAQEGYTKLNDNFGGISIGFLSTDISLEGCGEEDVRMIKVDRKFRNIYPQ